MLFVSFLVPLEPLLGGNGGFLGTKSGPTWMPKQLKIDTEIHIKSKVILSSIFVRILITFEKQNGAKICQNPIKNGGHIENCRKLKNLIFPCVFQWFSWFRRSKNQPKSIKNPSKTWPRTEPRFGTTFFPILNDFGPEINPRRLPKTLQNQPENRVKVKAVLSASREPFRTEKAPKS